jgi:hypothetical protein
MKRLVCVVLAATVALGVTGCGAEHGEAYWESKARCIKGTYESVSEGTNPIIKSWEQLDINCGKSAEKYQGMTDKQIIEEMKGSK